MNTTLTNRKLISLDRDGELIVDDKTVKQLADEEGEERLSWLEYLRDRLEYGRYKTVDDEHQA